MYVSFQDEAVTAKLLPFHDMPKECEGWRCHVFGLAKQSVSFNGTVCFIKENTLFLLTKHLVLLHKNKMFLYTETTCFPMLKQSVQCCELMN